MPDIADPHTHLICLTCGRVMIPNRKLTARNAERKSFPNHLMYMGHEAVPALQNSVEEFRNQ